MKLSMSASNNEVRLSKGNVKLTLKGNDNKVVTGDGTEAKLWMFTRDNRLMVPFNYVTQYFGYKLTTLADGTLVRATNGEAALSNEKFAEKHKALLKKEESENKPPIYLTFDDGPTAHTDNLLNVLKKNMMRRQLSSCSGRTCQSIKAYLNGFPKKDTRWRCTA